MGRTTGPAGLLEEHADSADTCAVSFEYFNPTASEVYLAGSFNDWQPQVMPLKKRQDGKWCTEMLLKPGQYEYRFVVDGQWQDDPMAAQYVANSFGSLNSVLKVAGLQA